MKNEKQCPSHDGSREVTGRIRSLFVCLSVALLMLSGCGGGTTGTDGGTTVTVKGTAQTVSGSPLIGALITVAESGDSARTSERGEFSIDTRLTTNSASLLIEQEGQEVRTSSIPLASAVNGALTVTVVVSDPGVDFEVVSVDIVSRTFPESPPTNSEDGRTPETSKPVASPTPEQTTTSILIGTVVDSMGRPISEVQVRLTQNGRNRVVEATTGESGRFSFEFPVRTRAIQLSFEKYGGSATIKIDALPRTPSVIRARFHFRTVAPTPPTDVGVVDMARVDLIGDVDIRDRR